MKHPNSKIVIVHEADEQTIFREFTYTWKEYKETLRDYREKLKESVAPLQIRVKRL